MYIIWSYWYTQYAAYFHCMSTGRPMCVRTKTDNSIKVSFVALGCVLWNETATMQFAHCRFPGFAISDAKILI